MRNDETRGMNEAEIAQRLANELPMLLPNLTLEKIEREARVGRGSRADLVIRARSGKLRKTLVLEVKSIGEPRIVERAITQLRTVANALPESYPMFAAPYISERARELCRANGIGYVDLAGDAFLQFGPVLIDRVGPRSETLERRGLRSLLAPKATRVLRTVLQSPNQPKTLTEIAQKCSMSIAGVYLVVDLLQSKGFVERDAQKRVTVPQPRSLLLEWAKAWNIERNRERRYFSFVKAPEQVIGRIADASRETGTEYAFTGMAGASLVAPFVRFEDVWAYVKGDQASIVKAMDLRPVSSGANVVLMEPYDVGVFADSRAIDGKQVVSDVQLIVDLYTNPARGLEQAEYIMNRSATFKEAS